VFAAAAQAPLTAIASVAEMTANFALTLPIMLACGIAAAVSKQLSYGSVYTTKLLRRGIDIERPRTTNLLQRLTVADVMHPIPQPEGDARLLRSLEPGGERDAIPDELWERLAGPVTDTRKPQELFGDETLEQALRQLTLYDHDGLPVVSHDRQHLQGWITRQDVLQTLATSVSSSATEIEHGAIAADFAAQDPEALAHTPSTPLSGYEIVEITITPESPALGRHAGNISWPPGSLIVAVSQRHHIVPVRYDTELHAGERIILLAPAASHLDPS
jgi:CIC family chloride channel protein